MSYPTAWGTGAFGDPHGVGGTPGAAARGVSGSWSVRDVAGSPATSSRPAASLVSVAYLGSCSDLSLCSRLQKTFTPNIISRKIKEDAYLHVGVLGGKTRREKGTRFGSHPAAAPLSPAGSWDKTVDMSDFGPSHIINIKKEKRETDEETKQILRMLQKDDFLDDPGLKNDIRNKPVQLPLAHSGWLFKEEEELLFLQLPDTLPGQPPTQDTKPIKTELQNEEGQMVVVKQEKSQEAKQAENICTLADLPEGQVGKLLIRKSGKVQLVLGKVTLDVTMGTPCSFLQELVSVSVGDNRTGEMIVLGHVKHKLVCSPDFEALLEHRHR
uniref:RNA polymerase III subunit D n=1 Tax=Bubo bubo TaxID=30461 RepID=A0A8C0EAN8_BUBBB